MAAHELVAIDAYGELCACGTKSPDHLEHLGHVALRLMDAPPARKGRARRDRPDAAEVIAWEAAQAREANLASFRMMTVEWFPQPSRRANVYSLRPNQDAPATTSAPTAARRTA